MEERNIGKKSVEDAAEQSIQSRATDKADVGLGGIGSIGGGMFQYLFRAGENISPWWSTQRDINLRRFVKSSDHMSGSEALLTAKVVNIPLRVEPRDLSLKSHMKQADEYSRRLFEESEFGQGWIAVASKWLEDYWNTDNGGFFEVIGRGKKDGPIVGPALGLASLDSTRIIRKKNQEFPLAYIDEDGHQYRLHKSRVAYASDQPSPILEMRGVGFCAVSRAINVAQHLVDISTYNQEKLGSRQPRGVLFTPGIPTDVVQATLNMASEMMDNQSLRRFARIPILGGDDTAATFQLIDLVSLPDGFDQETSTRLGMFAIALAFGVPIRWIWPAATSGATKADAMYQHIAGLGGGVGRVLKTLTLILGGDPRGARHTTGKFLPPHLKLVFDFQDDEQDRMKADIRKTRMDVIATSLETGVTTLRVAREQMLEAGDITEAQFNQMELQDGRLPSGEDVLTLFYATENELLDLGVDDPLDVERNDGMQMIDAIEDRMAEVRKGMPSVSSTKQKEARKQALAALGKLREAYEKVHSAQQQATDAETDEQGQGEDQPGKAEDEEAQQNVETLPPKQPPVQNEEIIDEVNEEARKDSRLLADLYSGIKEVVRDVIRTRRKGGAGSGWHGPPRGTHGEGSEEEKLSLDVVLDNLTSAGYDVRDRPWGQWVSPNGKGISPTNKRGIVNHWELAIDGGWLPESEIDSPTYSTMSMVNGLIKKGWLRSVEGGFASWDLPRLHQEVIIDYATRRPKNDTIYLDVAKTGRTYRFSPQDLIDSNFDLQRTLRTAESTQYSPSEPLDLDALTNYKSSKNFSWREEERENLLESILQGVWQDNTKAWSSLSSVPKHLRSMNDATLSLAQVNHLARMADAIEGSGQDTSIAWATARSQFKKLYRKEGDKWVKKEEKEKEKGGPGSGHHGHSGIPGKRGGSAPGGGVASGNVTYYHVTGPEYREGDPLLSRGRQRDVGIETPWKWGEAEEGFDEDAVAVFDSLSDARRFKLDFLPKGRILKIVVDQEDIDNPISWQTRRGIVSPQAITLEEGFTAFTEGIPAEWIQEEVKQISSVQTYVEGEKGGPGSGHHGHAGVPGKRGGSSPGGGSMIPDSISVSQVREKLGNPSSGMTRLYHATGGTPSVSFEGPEISIGHVAGDEEDRFQEYVSEREGEGFDTTAGWATDDELLWRYGHWGTVIDVPASTQFGGIDAGEIVYDVGHEDIEYPGAVLNLTAAHNRGISDDQIAAEIEVARQNYGQVFVIESEDAATEMKSLRSYLSTKSWSSRLLFSLKSLSTAIKQTAGAIKYKRELWWSAQNLWNGNISRSDFLDIMGQDIPIAFEFAWLEAVRDEGITSVDDLEEEERAELQRRIALELTFVGGFADYIIAHSKAEGFLLRSLEPRISMWAARYMDIHDQARVAAGGVKKYKFVYDPLKENCWSCARLNGQIRRMSAWKKFDCRPKHSDLECMRSANGPTVCGCEFEETDEPASRGPLPKWRSV